MDMLVPEPDLFDADGDRVRNDEFGAIHETRYGRAGADAGGGAAAVISSTDLSSGDVAHLPVDAPDIHCMHNPTSDLAITIHVYGGDAGELGPNVKRIYTSET